MGYYTTFDLTWDDFSETPGIDDQIADYFGQLPYWQDGGYEFSGSDIFIPEAKWYDVDDDMFKLSRAFPEVLFHLWGNGEEADDLWTEHWRNGKYQHCHAEIPPYDEYEMREYRPGKR